MTQPCISERLLELKETTSANRMDLQDPAQCFFFLKKKKCDELAKSAVCLVIHLTLTIRFAHFLFKNTPGYDCSPEPVQHLLGQGGPRMESGKMGWRWGRIWQARSEIQVEPGKI